MAEQIGQVQEEEKPLAQKTIYALADFDPTENRHHYMYFLTEVDRQNYIDNSPFLNRGYRYETSELIVETSDDRHAKIVSTGEEIIIFR